MKKGDVVKIQDTSYSTSVIDGKLEYPGRSLKYKQCTVIELGCIFPRTSCWDGDNVNDTIIQVCETGQIIFIEERFLELMPPRHRVMIDIIGIREGGFGGRMIEISDKLYKEIKRDS